MKNLFLLTVLFLTVLLTGCSEPDQLTIKGKIIEEDQMELTNVQKVLSNLDDCHIYLIETETDVYVVMTPSLTSDPLDVGYEGEFVLGELKATGKADDYVGGEISTTEVELRDLISYK